MNRTIYELLNACLAFNIYYATGIFPDSLKIASYINLQKRLKTLMFKL